MRSVIITAKVHPSLPEALEKSGYTIVNAQTLNYDQLYEIIPEAEGIIVTTRVNVDKKLIDRGGRLKWIGRLGSGMEIIDVDHASSKGIHCISSPEGNRNAVAEHCLGMLLNLTKKISSSFEEIKNKEWLRESNRGIEISGRTIGIVGFGNTGQAFAKLLSSFNVTILVYDKYKFDFGGGYIKEANMEQIGRYADVISFHVPLSEETKNMANAEFFNSLLSKPIILNTSRGSVVDLDALKEALEKNQVTGAALDVLPNEKLSSYNNDETSMLEWLTNQSTVLLTPHTAGWSEESFYKMAKVLLAKLELVK